MYASEDYPLLTKWFEGHGEPAPQEKALSSFGVVEEHAMGFLYTTDSSICWLENLVTNPFAPKKKREESLQEVIPVLLHFAKGKTVLCITDLPGVKNRAEKYGFITRKEKFFLSYREV